MTISVRCIRTKMREAVPGVKISEDAVRLLKIYLERQAEEVTIHASRIHERENLMRDQLGERRKVILSPRHVKMAIEGKFPGPKEAVRADSEH